MFNKNSHNNNPDTYQNSQSGANRSRNLMPVIDLMELARFVGEEKANYYVSKYEKMRLKNSIISWNWAAFLFSGLWIIYRKMYNYAMILIVIGFSTGFFLHKEFVSTLGIIWAILAGFFGNYLYFIYIEKQLSRTSAMSYIEKDNYLKSVSGVNKGTMIGIYVGIGFSILLIVVLAILQAFNLIPTR